MAHALFTKERRRASPVYIGWIQIAGFSSVSLRVDLESVSARKRLEIVSKPFNDYSLGLQNREKSGGKASGRIFRNEWRWLRRRFYQNTCISASRLLDVAGSIYFVFRPASRVNFHGKNKAVDVISFFVTVSLHLHWEIRTSEWASLGESRIDRARSTSIVNARHALTPSGCICIQQRKQRCWPPLVHRYAPLGSFSLNVDEGRRDGNKTFPLKRWRKGQSFSKIFRKNLLSVQFTLTFIYFNL